MCSITRFLSHSLEALRIIRIVHSGATLRISSQCDLEADFYRGGRSLFRPRLKTNRRAPISSRSRTARL